MATSVIQTRFDVGTELPELWRVDSVAPITRGMPNVPLHHTGPRYTSDLFAKHCRLWQSSTGGNFESIVGKGENAGNQHFLISPWCFKNPSRRQMAKYLPTFTFSHVNDFSLVTSEILSYVYEFTENMPSPIALSVDHRTWEQEVAGSIPGLANILSEDLW